MEKHFYYNDLFSIYKELLTEKEREVFSFYYEENLSIGEIAENREVSRSAIGNTIKIVEKKLENFEKILHIYENNKKILYICDIIESEIIKNELLKLVN